MGAGAGFQIVNAAGDIVSVDAFAFEQFRRAEALITDAALAEMAPPSWSNVQAAAWLLAVAAIKFVQKYLKEGYQGARELVYNEEFEAGSVHGFVMGLLDWEFSSALYHFGRFQHFKIYTMDDGLNLIHVQAYNRGLASGFRLSKAFPDDAKKAWVRALRKNAGIDHLPDGWVPRSDSQRDLESARRVHINYVIDLAQIVRADVIDGQAALLEYRSEQDRKLQRNLRKQNQMMEMQKNATEQMNRSAQDLSRNFGG